MFISYFCYVFPAVLSLGCRMVVDGVAWLSLGCRLVVAWLSRGCCVVVAAILFRKLLVTLF